LAGGAIQEHETTETGKNTGRGGDSRRSIPLQHFKKNGGKLRLENELSTKFLVGEGKSPENPLAINHSEEIGGNKVEMTQRKSEIRTLFQY